MSKPKSRNGKKNLIGPQLKALRARDDISQRDLAVQLQLLGLNVEKDVITRIETNKRYVNDFEIQIIAKYFKVSYQYLIDGEECL
ncbi:helix-turn-helix domain-containing protein [Fumia xinanensis]|uniref:Helix-turn-helix transcriptional regulator n=1 Tax=Fumia xinanensis TaxID=2763659 RepID=A0A926I6U0_9FIRM|nr:helix-turn-helix transcriptional regulator [Fumia xinanensis]MBC8560250.1 helix-turn-helix transcriptional regulator [Fumia xinanensis]